MPPMVSHDNETAMTGLSVTCCVYTCSASFHNHCPVTGCKQRNFAIPRSPRTVQSHLPPPDRVGQDRAIETLKSHPLIILLLLGGLLSGCATTEQAPPTLTFNPDQHARIRVFHGGMDGLYLGDICDGGSHPVIRVATGLLSFLRSETIGMPTTDAMPPFFYHEYVIPAGQPMTVKIYWQAQTASGTWQHCGPEHVTFTPEAGHDYDTFMKLSGGTCQVKVRKFMVSGDGKITTTPAPLNRLPFRRCG